MEKWTLHKFIYAFDPEMDGYVSSPRLEEKVGTTIGALRKREHDFLLGDREYLIDFGIEYLAWEQRYCLPTSKVRGVFFFFIFWFIFFVFFFFCLFFFCFVFFFGF